MIPLLFLLYSFFLAMMLRIPPFWAILGAMLPTLDAIFPMGFPLAPFGVLHTPVFFLVVSGLAYYYFRDGVRCLSFLLGGISHLLLEISAGIRLPLLYPMSSGVFSLLTDPVAVLPYALSVGSLSFILYIFSERREVFWVPFALIFIPIVLGLSIP